MRLPSSIRDNPALVGGFVQAILAVLIAFGINLSVEQTAAILGLVGVLTAIVVNQKTVATWDALILDWDDYEPSEPATEGDVDD